MQSSLVRVVSVYVLVALIIITLYVAKPLLEPIAIAGILTMLFVPLSAWLEDKGINKVVAAVVCVSVFLLIISSIGALFYSQLSSVGNDFSVIRENISDAIGKVQQFIQANLGIEIKSQNKVFNQQQITDGDGVKKMVTTAAGSLISMLLGFVLMLAYMVFMIYYRGHFKNFILKVVPEGKKENTQKIITQSLKVVPRYFSGLGIIIVSLWFMYGIGFSLLGLKGALFFALLCGSLEVIPFVGNITGSSLAALMALSQGGGVSMVIGVLCTYALVQFIQFYIISPVVFREEININPFFIIVILLAGELLWGVPGMIIAIPVLGIAKIIFSNIESLKPYAYLIGKESSGKKSHPLLRFKKLLGIK